MHIDHHNLTHEFPELVEKMNHLKATDGHFAHLCETYDALDADIRKIEKGEENLADPELEALKLKRVHLKDQLYHRLQA